MKIYLADLYHVYTKGQNTHTNPYAVPLGIGYLASALKLRMPHCEVRLFRNPDRLLAAVRAHPPDLIGFSYSWNLDLTNRVSKIIKQICPGVVTVAGGPSVYGSDEQIADFFRLAPTVDYVVPNEGETGFLALVQLIEAGRHRSAPIPGVCYLDGSNLVRGGYDRPMVPSDQVGFERISSQVLRPIGPTALEIPSPYLDGTLDEFLDEGLVPIVQTMRGCPYRCHFCVSGATEWNNMRGYSVERVEAEIEYALSRGASKDLILTDENWGILGERDVEIARFIMERHRRSGLPGRLYYYTAKVVTDASRAIVEMVAPIAWLGEFTMSFQTLNPESRAAIKRTNIGLDKVAANVRWARDRQILTSSEMIYGFPYETPQTFFDGIEQLGERGIDRLILFPLMLFPGIELDAKAAREQYGIQTRFRLANNDYGIYDGGALISAEAEEIVVGTRWSTVEDYHTVRRYGFFHEVVKARRYLSELLRLCAECGVAGHAIIRHLTFMDYSAYPALRQLLAEHHREAEAELKSSRDEVRDEAARRLASGDEPSAIRLNLVYLGKLMSSPEAVRELLEAIGRCTGELLAEHPLSDLVWAYVHEVLPHRIVVLSRRSNEPIRFESRFDYSNWANRSYRDLSHLLLSRPQRFQATLSEELESHLYGFDPSDRFDLQRIFEKTHSKHLLRSVQECRPSE